MREITLGCSIKTNGKRKGKPPEPVAVVSVISYTKDQGLTMPVLFATFNRYLVV